MVPTYIYQTREVENIISTRLKHVGHFRRTSPGKAKRRYSWSTSESHFTKLVWTTQVNVTATILVGSGLERVTLRSNYDIEAWKN